MSNRTGVVATTTALPIENWGALKWTTNQQSQTKLGGCDENSLAMPGVKEEKQVNLTNGDKALKGDEAVLQLVSLPKPQQQSSGAPASAVEKPIVQIPVSAIASASATTKNDLSLSLRPQASVTVMQDNGANVSLELTSVRFAIPNVCFGYEQTEEAGRKVLLETQEQMKKYQYRLLGDSGGAAHAGANDQLLVMVAGGHRKDERVVAVFDDIIFSYPSGRYKLIVSNYALVLEDKKRATAEGSGVVTSVPLSDVLQLYLCDIPDSGAGEGEDEELAQYVVVILRNPLKIRTTTYNHLVISCPVGFTLDEAHPWRCQLETQEEIDRLLATLPHNQANSTARTTVKMEEEGKVIKNTFTPTMSGRVSEIIIRVLKAMTGVTALGGFNKEYQTSKGHSVLRCLHHGAHGLLFILQSALLFLHRPVTRVLLSDITQVEVDESEGGNATFQIVVYGKFGKRGGLGIAESKIVFSALDKREKMSLLAYLEKKVTVRRIGLSLDDEDEEDDDDDEEDGREDNDDEETDDDDDDDDDDDEDSDDSPKRHKRSRGKREKPKGDKKKHHQHHKKHKKDRE